MLHATSLLTFVEVTDFYCVELWPLYEDVKKVSMAPTKYIHTLIIQKRLDVSTFPLIGAIILHISLSPLFCCLMMLFLFIDLGINK